MQPFQFKQFAVNQNRCAMKIGTDAVLLGAWTSLEAKPFSILDIGAGTGILALMMAQRSTAELIDAIEIDDAAYEQCVDNFEQSPWADRLFCYHAALDEFVEDLLDEESGMDDSYDLIISNPPFYTDTYKSDNEQRDMARFADAMPFRQLIESVSKLLSEKGLFSVIIPFSEEKDFIVLASKEHLYPQRILRVKGTPDSEIKRSLIEFSFDETVVQPQELIIETSRHQYTAHYIALTKDFYLKM
ncbi:tRNA1Val (adenine37-N6)-methyltransferase [Gelidibacter sediminis]|uniref:tRNA1(Val) (adenine(37)-N6)-methyltransferase n=1 Tax=Gelidibacter sediminis TaxID=1608710 RepID=A0A4R7Q6A9_9FLAO|nr:methyltransferase [Gelidibacter sediminis]TDU43123.1 tRNA1Val (adenine37-N6)-methyltransferase [Gelidibacter sediminis]